MPSALILLPPGGEGEDPLAEGRLDDLAGHPDGSRGSRAGRDARSLQVGASGQDQGLTEHRVTFVTETITQIGPVLRRILGGQAVRHRRAVAAPAGEGEYFDEYIIEPDREALMGALLPKTLKLKIYTVLLDASAAEHAARTVAMQTATDNAEDILQELSLEYNKSRQQKITSEILDLVGGMQE